MNGEEIGTVPGEPYMDTGTQHSVNPNLDINKSARKKELLTLFVSVKKPLC